MKSSIFLFVLTVTLASARVVLAEPQLSESMVTCLAADAIHEPIWPTKIFPVSGKQMVCVFRLGEDESFSKLTSKWIAVDVGDAAPDNTLIAESDLDLQGQKTGKVRYSQPGALPVGKYRLEILGDSKPWKSLDFEVAADPKPLQIAKPQDLLPLTEGQTWTYDFVQESGPGGRISAPGEKLDSDGKLRATVTITVGKTDEVGSEIIVKRNGKTMTREWWKLDAKGLVAIQRETDAEVLRLEPPQPLLPLTSDAYYSWSYSPDNRAFSQLGQLWTSLPIASPSGKAAGFLSVIEQPTPLGKITVERRFIPGVGMVHESITSSLGPRLLSRLTMTLVAAPPKKVD